jgi:hypothetical protein
MNGSDQSEMMRRSAHLAPLASHTPISSAMARRQFLVTEHETFAEILRKWNFVPHYGIRTAN